MNGISKFNPLVTNNPSIFEPRGSLDDIMFEINEQIAIIREWQSVMNIIEFRGWTDRLTGDIHIILRADKIAQAKEHIGEAAEIENPRPRNP